MEKTKKSFISDDGIEINKGDVCYITQTSNNKLSRWYLSVNVDDNFPDDGKFNQPTKIFSIEKNCQDYISNNFNK